ncbi:hypothetical protein GC163_03785 [bacterium]|nr:hypothetical protein [bacterium]
MRTARRSSLIQVLAILACGVILTSLWQPAPGRSHAGHIRVVVRKKSSQEPAPPIYVALLRQPHFDALREEDWNGIDWISFDEIRGVWMETLPLDRPGHQTPQQVEHRSESFELLANVLVLVYPQPDGTARICPIPLLRQRDQVLIDLRIPIEPPQDAEFVSQFPIPPETFSAVGEAING